MTAKVEPGKEALEAAELLDYMVNDPDYTVEKLAARLNAFAAEAVAREREACRQVVQEHIDRHDDPETGTGSETCRTTFCECFGITTLVEIQSAIAARREPKP